MSKVGKKIKRLSPITFPYSRHVRTENPRHYSDHRSYKSTLRKEFGAKCVYCQKLDYGQDIGSFHVEHYLPQKFFPELRTQYSNLYYACAACNRNKKTHWSNDLSRKIPNPCEVILSQHYKFDSATGSINAVSPAGQFTSELLRFNSEDSISYRAQLVSTAKHLIKYHAVCVKDKDFGAAQEIEETLSKILARDLESVTKILSS